MENLFSIEKHAYLLFGKIACEQEVLNESQLQKALLFQQDNPSKKLGEICIFLGYLSLEAVKLILEEQEHALRQNLTKWYRLPDLVLESLLLSGRFPIKNISTTVLLQAKEMKKNYPDTSLLDILFFHLKTIDTHEVDTIKNSIKVLLAYCSTCQREYNLFNYSSEIIHCAVCFETPICLKNNDARDSLVKKTEHLSVAPENKTARFPIISSDCNKVNSSKNNSLIGKPTAAKLPAIKRSLTTKTLPTFPRSKKNRAGLFSEEVNRETVEGSRELFLEKIDLDNDLEGDG